MKHESANDADKSHRCAWCWSHHAGDGANNSNLARLTAKTRTRVMNGDNLGAHPICSAANADVVITAASGE